MDQWAPGCGLEYSHVKTEAQLLFYELTFVGNIALTVRDMLNNVEYAGS
jgi:hypothetical protein